jgi:hypothetical protein
VDCSSPVVSGEEEASTARLHRIVAILVAIMFAEVEESSALVLVRRGDDVTTLKRFFHHRLHRRCCA